MIYRHSFLFAIAMEILSSAALIACSNDDDNNGGGNGSNGGLLENEVLLSMLKGDKDKATKLDDCLYIGEDYNFQSDYRDADFALLANVNKLGGITNIPKSGWAKKIAVRKGYGYVCCVDNNPENFYRIYVEDEICDTDGKLIGYTIRYQHPFYGKDIDIQLPKNELTFTGKGGEEELKFLDSEPVCFSCESSADWCRTTPSSSLGKNFLTNAVDVSVATSDTIGVSTATITLTTGYGKKKEFTVTRGAAEPRMKLYDNNYSNVTSMSIYAGGASKYVYVNSNIPLEDIEVINTASDWCEAKLGKNSDDDYYGRRYGNYILIVTATENDTDTKRTGTITLKYRNGDTSVKLNLEQDASYITMENNYSMDNPYILDCSYDSYLYFRTNLYRDDIKVANSTDWLSTSIYDYDYYNNYYRSYLWLSYSRNTSSSDREDIVTISNKKGTVSYSFKVKQSGR